MCLTAADRGKLETCWACVRLPVDKAPRPGGSYERKNGRGVRSLVLWPGWI